MTEKPTCIFGIISLNLNNKKNSWISQLSKIHSPLSVEKIKNLHKLIKCSKCLINTDVHIRIHEMSRAAMNEKWIDWE